MADTAVAITAGTGTNIDTRTEASNGNHRQVIVIGDPSTNAGVAPVDVTKGLAVDLTNTGINANAILVTLATLPVVATGSLTNAGGSLSAFQGGSWLVSVATLPVIANINNTSIPVTQSGTWDEIGINDSGNSITVDGNIGVIGGSLSSYVFGGSISAFNAGGSLTAFQGGSWLVSVATLPVMANVINSSIPVTQSGTWDEVGIHDSGNSITIDGTVTADLGATDNAVLDAIAASTAAIETAVEGTLTVTGGGGGVEYTEGDTDATIVGSAIMWEDGSDTLRAVSAAKPLPVSGTFEVAGQATVTALQGGTWNVGGSISSYVFGGSISAFNAGGSLTAFQGGNWLVSVATLPVMANIVNSTIAVTQSGTWDEIGINDSGNSITIDGNVGNIGGSLSAYVFGGSISAFNAGGSLSVWNAGGSLSSFQGGAWVVANAGGSLSAWSAGGSLSAFNAGGSLSAYNVGGSLSAFQGGVWNIAGSISAYNFGGSLSAFNAGGSLTAFQGGTWNVYSSMASGTNFIAGGQFLPSLISLSSLAHSNHKLDMFNNLMVNTNVPLPNSVRLNKFLTYASMASLMAAPGAGKRLVVREMDFSVNATVSIKLVEDHTGTPATVWGPHYFLPYAGIVKPQTYIPLTANKSLGVDITGTAINSTLDIRIETENS